MALNHIPNALVVITDDASYVRLIELEHVAKTRKAPLHLDVGCDQKNFLIFDPENPWNVSPDTYGPEKFPKYTDGGGYVLSHYVNKCAAKVFNRALMTKRFSNRKRFHLHFVEVVTRKNAPMTIDSKRSP